MNHRAVTFSEGRATAGEIQTHLEQCDGEFVPRLSSKVDIGQYASKLRAFARTFEAWSGTALVGLVAAYMNDRATSCAFISSVSVAAELANRGVASTLLDQCLNRARQEGMDVVRLEVNPESHSAIRRYRHLGFSEIIRKDKTVIMELELTCRRPS